MSKIEESLGACPFCGGALHVLRESVEWYAACGNECCGAAGPLRPSPQEAAAAWLSVFPRLGLPVKPPEGHVRVRLLVWTDWEGAARVELLDATGKPSPYARPSVVAADVPLQTVYEIHGVRL